MKNFLFALIFVFAFASCAFASDDDVYVRKDVFEAKFDRIFDEFAKLHQDTDELKAGQKAISEELAKQNRSIEVLSARLEETNRLMDIRFEDMNRRFDSASNTVYFWFVLFGALIGMPYIQRGFEWAFRKEPQLTAEDVKRMIDEALNQRGKI